MKLLFSRHGNTFGPGDPVVWAGSTNDLPLVQKGIEQAQRLAAALQRQAIVPQAIYCSALERTRRYAQEIIDHMGLSLVPVVDARIHEIDYGQWTGLTHEQVVARFGQEALDRWDLKSMWPTEGGWGGSPQQVRGEVKSFVEDLASRHAFEDTVLVVTSNGRLRFFLELVPDEFAKRVRDGTFKVKTGHVCKLILGVGVPIQILYWNQEPHESFLL